MSKITTQDKIKSVEIIRKLIKNYGVQYTSDVSDGVLAELDNRVKKFEREMTALLAPPVPKQPKASRKRESKSPAAQELEHLQRAQTASSEPIASHVPDKFYGSRRGRNGKSE